MGQGDKFVVPEKAGVGGSTPSLATVFSHIEINRLLSIINPPHLLEIS